MSCGGGLGANASGDCTAVADGGAPCTDCQSSPTWYATGTGADPSEAFSAPFIPLGNEGAASSYVAPLPFANEYDEPFSSPVVVPPGNEGAASGYVTPLPFDDSIPIDLPEVIVPPGNDGAASGGEPGSGGPGMTLPGEPSPGCSCDCACPAGGGLAGGGFGTGGGGGVSLPQPGQGGGGGTAFSLPTSQPWADGGSATSPAGETSAYSREPFGTYGVQCRTSLNCWGEVCRTMGCHQDLSNCLTGGGYPRASLQSPGPWVYCINGKSDIVYPTSGPHAVPDDWAWHDPSGNIGQSHSVATSIGGGRGPLDQPGSAPSLPATFAGLFAVLPRGTSTVIG